MYTPPGGTYATYVPQSKRLVGAVTPQQNPELFSVKDIKREITMLVNADKRYGAHALRAAARLKLFGHIAARRSEHGMKTP